MNLFFKLSIIFIIASSLQAKTSIEKAGDIIQIALPAYAIFNTYQKKDPTGLNMFLQSLASTLVATHSLKLLIDKKRPDGSANNSFPSGHTAAAFSASTFLHKRYKGKAPILYYALASFVGYSRVYAKRHFTEDVLASVVLAYGINELFVENRLLVGVGAVIRDDIKYVSLKFKIK